MCLPHNAPAMWETQWYAPGRSSASMDKPGEDFNTSSKIKAEQYFLIIIFAYAFISHLTIARRVRENDMSNSLQQDVNWEYCGLWSMLNIRAIKAHLEHFFLTEQNYSRLVDLNCGSTFKRNLFSTVFYFYF